MQLTGLGLGLLGDLEEVAKGGVARVVTTTGPLGAAGWGSALGALGGFGGQGLLVLPPLPVSLPVPGGPLLLPRKRAAAAALQRALAPRVLVRLLVLLNPVGAQPFAGPVWPRPNPPAPLAEAEGKPFHPQPVFGRLQAVGAHVLAELKAPGHAAFALGMAVAIVLVPHQSTQ